MRGITGVTVEGYKSLHGPQSISIKPLTILAGVNSAGKSSIIQPLLLLKQTIEAPYDPGPLLLDGPNVSVTKIEQILTKGRMANAGTFSVSVQIDDHDTKLTFGKDSSGDIRILEMTGWFNQGQAGPVTLKEGMTPQEISVALPAVPKIFEFLIEEWPRGERPEVQVVRQRSFLEVSLRMPGDKETHIGELTFLSSAAIETEISRIVHLPALRGNPRRTYRTTAVEGRFPGTFDPYTAGIIAAWQNRGRKEKLRDLRKDLEELGLTWKVEARQLDDTQVELLVGRLPQAVRGGDRDLVNTADVGFGVSQTLPVVVALLVADSGQCIYLEQPEIHLHPRAQVAFARLVQRAMRRGVRIVIETHSSLFVRAVQTLVALGDIDRDDVALHWFSRDPRTGYTTITSAELDEEGSFGDWPEDFDEVLLDLESKYLDAATRRAE